MREKVLFTLFVALLAAGAQAQQRVVRLPYTTDLIPIRTTPLHVTVLELQADEQIQSIIIGDSERWRVQHTSGTDGRPLIVIKPTDKNIQTNMVVTTTARVYNFELKSGPENSYQAYVRFGYPGEEIIQVAPPAAPLAAASPAAATAATAASSQTNTNASNQPDKNPPANRFNYRYRWDRRDGFPWSPVSVYDDGHRTFIRVPDVAARYELPVLRVYEDGQETVVNYTVRDGMYVVDRIFERAELVIGADVKKGFLGLGGHKQRARRLIIQRLN